MREPLQEPLAGSQFTAPDRIAVPPYGPVRVTLREHEYPLQPPWAATEDVPLGPVIVAFRLKACASPITVKEMMPMMKPTDNLLNLFFIFMILFCSDRSGVEIYGRMIRGILFRHINPAFHDVEIDFRFVVICTIDNSRIDFSLVGVSCWSHATRS